MSFRENLLNSYAGTVGFPVSYCDPAWSLRDRIASTKRHVVFSVGFLHVLRSGCNSIARFAPRKQGQQPHVLSGRMGGSPVAMLNWCGSKVNTQ